MPCELLYIIQMKDLLIKKFNFLTLLNTTCYNATSDWPLTFFTVRLILYRYVSYKQVLL